MRACWNTKALRDEVTVYLDPRVGGAQTVPIAKGDRVAVWVRTHAGLPYTWKLMHPPRNVSVAEVCCSLPCSADTVAPSLGGP